MYEIRQEEESQDVGNEVKESCCRKNGYTSLGKYEVMQINQSSREKDINVIRFTRLPKTTRRWNRLPHMEYKPHNPF